MTNEQKKESSNESNVVSIKKDAPLPPIRKIRKRLALTSPDRVRTYIQGLMIAVENDEMTESKARLLTNQAEVIMRAINSKTQERQMIMLEQRLMDLENKKEF